MKVVQRLGNNHSKHSYAGDNNGVRKLWWFICSMLREGKLPHCNATVKADAVWLYSNCAHIWKVWHLLCASVSADLLDRGEFSVAELGAVATCARTN